MRPRTAVLAALVLLFVASQAVLAMTQTEFRFNLAGWLVAGCCLAVISGLRWWTMPRATAFLLAGLVVSGVVLVIGQMTLMYSVHWLRCAGLIQSSSSSSACLLDVGRRDARLGPKDSDASGDPLPVDESEASDLQPRSGPPAGRERLVVQSMTSSGDARGDPDSLGPIRVLRMPLRSAGTVFVAALVSAIAFLSVFRPWQGGLLEEWGITQLWDQVGIAAVGQTLPATMGRPLHILPQYLGLAISDGGFVGQHLVLGAVALGQLWGAYWALGRLDSSRSLRLALGLLVALHPWWPAGDLMRFLPAQVAVLSAVVWLGAATRYLMDGGARWLVVVVVVPLLGLLTYQSAALALLLAAACLAVVLARSPRAGLIVVGATTAAVVLSFVWTVVASRLVPDSYLAALASGGAPDLSASVMAVVRTAALRGFGVVVLGAATGAVVIALGFAQRLAPWRAWTLLAVVVLSPLAAMVYATSPFHLNDPERVVMPIGLTCWLVLATVSHLVATEEGLRRVVVVSAVGAALIGGGAAYIQWSGFAAAQQSLLHAVDDVRGEVPSGQTLVVADGSGRYGDVYTLLPPHLDIAVNVEFGPGASTVLCTPDGVVRNHPFAAVYPIPTTESCTPLLSRPGVTRLSSAETLLGPVDFYVVPTAPLD